MLISSLVGKDTAFAMEVSQLYLNTNMKVLCNDQTFMDTLNLLEIKLSSKEHEDDEEQRKENNASLAMAVFTQKGSGKDKAKPVELSRQQDTMPTDFTNPCLLGRLPGLNSQRLDSLMGRGRLSLVQHVCWTLPV